MNQLTNRQLVLKVKPLFRYSSRENSPRMDDTTTTTITLTSNADTLGGIFDFRSYKSAKKNSNRFIK
jgi:hypothetical protein